MNPKIDVNREARTLGFEDIKDMLTTLHYWGWTNKRIADATGWSAAFVSGWAKTVAKRPPKPNKTYLRAMARRIARTEL